MREIVSLLKRLNAVYDEVYDIRFCGDGSWSMFDKKNCRVIETCSCSCDDPTACIVAVLKARLPPTKAEALESMRIIETNIPSGLHCVATVRRYLEAQKE